MATKASRGAPALEITASDGQVFAFATLEVVAEYAAEEHRKWAWLLHQQAVRSFHQIQQVLTPPIVALATPTPTELTGSADDAVKAEQLRSRLSGYLAFEPAIHDRAPLQAFILSVKDRSDAEATWALAWLAYQAGRLKGLDSLASQQWNQQGVLTGLASAWQWAGQSIESSAQTTALEQVESAKKQALAAQDHAHMALEETKGYATAAGDLVVSTTDSINGTRSRLGEFENQLNGRLEEEVAAGRTKFEAAWTDLTKTYAETLKLQAPAEYWGAKKDEHLRLAKAFAKASAAAGVVGAIVLCGLYAWLFKPATTSVIPPWNELLPSIVLAVVFLWLMRTLMRLTMSHVHLSLDAGERQTMVTCYLAMTKEGETSGDERSALFAAIFRPTGDGIVKDETPPVPLWEMLKAGKGGDK